MGGHAASYDNNGNVLSRYDASGTQWTFTYDAMNRLTSASNGTSNNFYYDGLGRQVARNIAGVITYTVWDGWSEFASFDSVNTPLTHMIYGPWGDLAANTYKGYHYHCDGLGSTAFLSGGAGTLLESYTYDPNGTPTLHTVSGGPYNTQFLFTGQQWYPTLGFYDLRNRAYLPGIGRFLQPDPIGFSGDPANLYRYCANNPAKWSDPSGLGDLKGTADEIVVTSTPIGDYRGSGPGPLGGPMGNSYGSGEPREYALAGDRPYPKDSSQFPPAINGTTVRITIGFGQPPPPSPGLPTVPGTGGNSDVGHYLFELDPHELSRFGPNATDAANLKHFANVVDATTISYLGAVGLAASGPALWAATVSTIQAAPVASAALISQAQPIITYVYLGVVIPTSTLTVTNPKAHEILEEAFEEWRKWQ